MSPQSGALELRDRLAQLRDLDRKLAALRARIASAGSSAHAFERVSQARRKLEVLRLDLEGLSSKIRQDEGESSSLDARLKALGQRIYGGKESASLLMSLQSELGQVEQQRELLDEELLGELERQESLQKQQAELVQLVAEQDADLARAREDDREQDERLRERLSQMEEQRKGLCAGLEPELLSDYERMLAGLGEATAQMRRAACTGCRMGLSDVIFRKFRLGELVRCPNCGRFLLEFQS